MRNQPHNTTAVYVDGTQVEIFEGNGYTQECDTIARMRQDGKIFFERTVFGYGRVALKFRTRKFA